MLILFIGCSFLWFVKFVPNDNINDYSVKKIFHVQIYLMLSVGIYYTPLLMRLCLSFLIWSFWIIELIR